MPSRHRCVSVLAVLPLLLLSNAAAFIDLAHVARDVRVPETLQATWVKLQPIATNPTDGIPEARCDHSLELLQGLSLRPNVKVPFPNGMQPTVDPYQHHAFMYGGHIDAGFPDPWLLDLGASPPAWTKLPSIDTASELPRWATPTAFIPNGIDPADSGLTVVFMDGSNVEDYVRNVKTYNLASGTWRILQDLSTNDPSQPFPRAYCEWYALPKGYGTGMVDSSTDSGDFFLLGGSGTLDWVAHSALDRDWNDQWIFDVASQQWQKSGSFICVANTTTCTDSQTLGDYLAQLATLGPSGAATAPDLAASERPEELFATVSQVVDGWKSLNWSAATAQNNPSACTTACSSYQAVLLPGETFSPTAVEGYRGVTVGNFRYTFGGYSCDELGSQAAGGQDCYLNSMWKLDLTTMLWSSIDPPAADSPFAQYWPSKRAYHVMVATSDKIYIQGGAYQDRSTVFYYYSDTFVFDIQLETFVPIKIGGIPPPIMWSAQAVLYGSDIILHGGCAGDSFYSDVYALKLGVLVGADNCEASGDGLHTAVAGEQATFSIQTREYIKSGNETAFGAVIDYGTGLLVSCQLVRADSQGDVVLIQADVEEIGGGAYQLTYVANFGTQYRSYVYVGSVQIPGSPFTMSLQPQSSPSASRTTADGLGIALAKKGGEGAVQVHLKDQFGNAISNSLVNITASGMSDNGSLSIVQLTVSNGPSANSLASIPIHVTSSNGSVVVSYSVPEDKETYVLSIQLNNQAIAGSPFTVTALDPIHLPHATVVAFLVLSAFNIAICFFAGAIVRDNHLQPIMRASSPNFLYVLILGSIMSSLSVIALVLEGRDDACQAYHSLLSIGVVVMMSSLLAKAYRVAKIFNARALMVSKNLKDIHLMVPTMAAVAVILIVNMLWIGLDPVKSQARPASNYPDVLTFQSCGSVHGLSFMIAIFVYVGVILLYGVYLAVQTSHVPDEFNESRIIAAAVYNIFFCAIIIVPLVCKQRSQRDHVSCILGLLAHVCSGFQSVCCSDVFHRLVQ